MDSDGFVALAAFGAPHGVRGQVKLRCYTNSAASLLSHPSLQLANGTTLRVFIEGGTGEQRIARIDGVHDRNAAEQWRNKEIGLPRSALPALANANQFYHSDLVGMQVVDAAGAPCGTVLQVANYGAGDILEIGTKEASEFYSFTHANFPRIDRDNRVIEFHAPEILVVDSAKK